jgi:hypothetical protein
MTRRHYKSGSAQRARRRQAAAREGRGFNGTDPTAGMPVGVHDPLTFEGRREQTAKLAAGLARLTGWRKVAARVGAAVVLALVVLLLVANAGRI